MHPITSSTHFALILILIIANLKTPIPSLRISRLIFLHGLATFQEIIAVAGHVHMSSVFLCFWHKGRTLFPFGFTSISTSYPSKDPSSFSLDFTPCFAHKISMISLSLFIRMLLSQMRSINTQPSQPQSQSHHRKHFPSPNANQPFSIHYSFHLVAPPRPPPRLGHHHKVSQTRSHHRLTQLHDVEIHLEPPA